MGSVLGVGTGDRSPSAAQELKIPLPQVIYKFKGLFRQYRDQTAIDTCPPPPRAPRPVIKHSLIFKYQAAASRLVWKNHS